MSSEQPEKAAAPPWPGIQEPPDHVNTRIPPGTFIPYCLREQMKAKGYKFCEGPRDGPGSKVMIDGFVDGPGMVNGVLHHVDPLTEFAKGEGPAIATEKAPAAPNGS